MPLLAYAQSGEPLVAPLMTDAQWEQLRSSKQPDAWMPYGGGRAILKVRGGLGFLDRCDEWSFCLTAARMVAEQERR
jgi:hypothetical protein